MYLGPDVPGTFILLSALDKSGSAGPLCCRVLGFCKLTCAKGDAFDLIMRELERKKRKMKTGTLSFWHWAEIMGIATQRCLFVMIHSCEVFSETGAFAWELVHPFGHEMQRSQANNNSRTSFFSLFVAVSSNHGKEECSNIAATWTDDIFFPAFPESFSSVWMEGHSPAMDCCQVPYFSLERRYLVSSLAYH